MSRTRHQRRYRVYAMKDNGGPHMIGMRALLLAFVVLAVAGGQPAAAQTIYPLTRAEILVGAKFDFKVEFSITTAPKEVKVTVNGRDAAQVFGKAPIVEVNEEGLGHTAYWMREVSLTQPGPYEVTAAAGDATRLDTCALRR